MCQAHMNGATFMHASQDAHRQRTIDWIDSTGGSAAAFDFTTKAVLQVGCTLP